MKKILRLDLFVTTVILCASFLLCGIVEINDKTSFVSSGQQSEVFRSQKQDGSPVLTLQKDETSSKDGTTFLSVDFSAVKNAASFAKYCCFPPFGSIISFAEQTGKPE